MNIKSFTEIIAWQKGHQLVLSIYRLTESFPKQELFVLLPQIRRCAISIPANIAEGFKRRTKNDSLHFYNIAEGSLEELKYYIILIKDLKYITVEQFHKIYLLMEELGKIIYGWKKIQK
jgi:four helix bundle protein